MAKDPDQTSLRAVGGGYVESVGGEPRNIASDMARMAIEVLNDRALALSDESAGLAAPGFTRIDRRPVIGQPPTDFEGYRQSHLALEEIAGQWPVYRLHEVLAVRGDRLAAARVSISLGDDHFGLEQIVLVQFDRDLQKAELMVIFDPDDLTNAVAELDRLQAEIDG